MSEKNRAELWENIFLNAPMGIFTTDLDGVVTSANRISREIHGEFHEEMLGKTFPEDFVRNAGLKDNIRQVSEEKTGRLETEYKTGRSARVVRLTSTLIRDRCYRPVGVLHMCEDLTILLETQEKVSDFKERLNCAGRLREIGFLTRGIVHDIKHIFSILLNYIFALKKENCTAEETARFLDMMEQTSHSAIGMVQRILDSCAEKPYVCERINVNQTVSELSKIMACSLPENITLHTDLPPRPVFMEGDSTQLRRLLLNLCFNARDAMSSGGQISIRLRGDNSRQVSPKSRRPGAKYFSLAVSDTGEGIAGEHREKIFDPFFTTRAKGKGIGIGLCVVRDVVEKAGGDICLKSSPGRGTTFTILLPISLCKEKEH